MACVVHNFHRWNAINVSTFHLDLYWKIRYLFKAEIDSTSERHISSNWSLLLTVEYAVDLGSGLHWRKPTVPLFVTINLCIPIKTTLG